MTAIFYNVHQLLIGLNYLQLNMTQQSRAESTARTASRHQGALDIHHVMYSILMHSLLSQDDSFILVSVTGLRIQFVLHTFSAQECSPTMMRHESFGLIHPPWKMKHSTLLLDWSWAWPFTTTASWISISP